MIWFSLALFAVSFVLTALLAPKPNLENARPEELDPDNFPKASEDAPVPLLFGCARIKGPNTLWYGDFQTVPIREKVKTGLFSSRRVTVGYDYFLSIDLGLCLGPEVILKKIFIDDVEVNADIEEVASEIITFFNRSPSSGQRWQGATLEETEGVPAFGIGYELTEERITVFNLVTDFNIDPLAIDAGGLNLNIGYNIAFFTNFATDGPVILSVNYFGSGNATGTELLDPNGSSNQSVLTIVQSGGVFRQIRVNSEIPPGTRSIRITAGFSPALVVFTSTVANASFIRVTGEAVIVREQSFDIYEPNLYGGKKEGGGHVGSVNYYPGNFDQGIDPGVVATVGAGQVPAYRGVAHMVWKNHYIGESPQLRKVEFLLGRYSDLLNNGFLGRLTDNGLDADPAEVLYYIMTDPWAGMGISPSQIDATSFREVGDTLRSEGNGISGVISVPQEGRRAANEILRQIDGILFENGQTGLIQLRLIRNDYDAATLPVFDEDDIIRVVNFQKTAWEDVKSEVKVSYSSRDQESGRVAIAQNMAVANMMGGPSRAEISFPFCYDAALANRLAARELSVLSTPLFKMQVQMNRSAYNFKPGDVIKISWPEYGLVEIIMRVQKIDVGQFLDNKIVVDLVQDVFAASSVVLATPEDTSWSDNRPEPETIAVRELVEMPFHLASNLENPVSDGFADVIPFGLRPQLASTTFTMESGLSLADLTTVEPDAQPYPLTALLTTDVSKFDGFLNGTMSSLTLDSINGGFQFQIPLPTTPTAAEVRIGDNGVMYIGGEWMTYETVTDNSDGTFTLTNVRRGVLGTQPLDHLDNSRVWFLDISLLGAGVKGATLASNDTLSFYLLDKVGSETRGIQDETVATFTPQDLADRPLRPRMLSIGGSRSQIPYVITNGPTFNLSWVSSNRAFGQITFENDAEQTPDQTEQYDLEVWVDGEEIVSQAATNITSPYAMDLSSLTGTSGEIRLYSRRSGGNLKSSAYYSFYPLSISVTADSTNITADDASITVDQT